MKKPGVILRKIREEKQLSLNQAAQKIQRSVGWLCEVENEKGNSRINDIEFDRVVELLEANDLRPKFSYWMQKDGENQIQKSSYLEGPIFKHLRKKSNITQKDAADSLGLSETYLSLVENGLRKANPLLKSNLMNLYGYSLGSFSNFVSENKRGANVPTRFKLSSILNLADEQMTKEILDFAIKLIVNGGKAYDGCI